MVGEEIEDVFEDISNEENHDKSSDCAPSEEEVEGGSIAGFSFLIGLWYIGVDMILYPF